MNCPACGGDSAVTDSRASGRFAKRRRRECRACAHRFSTYEVVDEALDQTVGLMIRMTLQNGKVVFKTDSTYYCQCGNEARYIVLGELQPRFCGLCDIRENEGKGERR